jgi:hypothetical protein
MAAPQALYAAQLQLAAAALQPSATAAQASNVEGSLQAARTEVLQLQERARLLDQEKTALQRRAEVAEAEVLELQQEAREHNAAALESQERIAELQRSAGEREAALQKQADASGERARGLALQLERAQHVANEHALQLQEQARLAETVEARAVAAEDRAKAAGARVDAAINRAEVAEAKVLEVQHEARTQQQRAEQAEERVEELRKGAAASFPPLMRAAESVGAAVAGMDLRELLALDGALAIAAEAIRTERAERARQMPMPEQFLCPISQAVKPSLSRQPLPQLSNDTFYFRRALAVQRTCVAAILGGRTAPPLASPVVTSASDGGSAGQGQAELKARCRLAPPCYGTLIRTCARRAPGSW